MQQILTGTGATVTSPPFTTSDGTTPADTASTPTVAVVSDAGQTVLPSPLVVTNLAAPGLYSIALTGFSGTDLLTVTWTGTVAGRAQTLVQQVEVVGGVYVTAAEMWAHPDVSQQKYDAAQIDTVRQEFEAIAERWTGQAWVPRYARESVHTGLLGRTQPRQLVSVTDYQGTTVDTTTWLLEPSGLIQQTGAWWSRQYPHTIRYRHGADRPPADLIAAAKTFIRSKLLEGGNRIGKDTLSFADPGGGTTRFSTPDWNAGRPTGLLDVDRVLCSLGSPLPGIA